MNGMFVQANLLRYTDGKQIIFFCSNYEAQANKQEETCANTWPLFICPVTEKFCPGVVSIPSNTPGVQILINAWNKSHQDSERNGLLLGEIHISHLLVQDEKQKAFFQSTPEGCL